MSCVEQKFPTRQSTIQNNPFGLRIPEILEVCAFFSLLFWSFFNIFTKKWFGNIVLTSRGQNWYFLDREIRGRNFRKNFGQVWNDFLLLLCQGLRFCQNFLQVFPPNNFEFFYVFTNGILSINEYLFILTVYFPLVFKYHPKLILKNNDFAPTN